MVDLSCTHCHEIIDSDFDHFHKAGGGCVIKGCGDICDRHREIHGDDYDALNDPVAYDVNYYNAYTLIRSKNILPDHIVEESARIYAESWDTTLLYPELDIDKESYATRRAMTVASQLLITCMKEDVDSEHSD